MAVRHAVPRSPWTGADQNSCQSSSPGPAAATAASAAPPAAIRGCGARGSGVRRDFATGVREGLSRSRNSAASSPRTLKKRYKLRQFRGFARQIARGRGAFLDHRGILLGHLVHLADRGIDLLDAGRLLLRAWAISVTSVLISITWRPCSCERLAGFRRPA